LAKERVFTAIIGTTLNASKFDVRGKNYLVDRKKISSAPNLLRLIAVDLLEVDEPLMDGFCSHPNGRVSS
jgi:hypothetical protein